MDDDPKDVDLVEVSADAPLLIQYLQGANDVLVVSIAGVGTKRTEQPPPEFYKLSRLDENHVLFVSDKSRSWMNGAGLADRIVTAIEAVVRDHGIKRVITLGNSMGGTMALLLPRLTKVDAAIAIVPQYSAHPDHVPEETRWRFFRKQITAWPFPAVDRLPDAPCETTILHGGDTLECHHLDRFPTANLTHHFVFPDHDHHLARELHRQGKLQRIIRQSILGHRYKARRVIENAGGMFRSAFDAQRNDLSTQENKR